MWLRKVKLVSDSSVAKKILNGKNDSQPKSKELSGPQNAISENAMSIQTGKQFALGKVDEQRKKKSDNHTCGAVTLAVRLPACTSINHAYSKESLPKGRPSAENIACALSWRPDKLM